MPNSSSSADTSKRSTYVFLSGAKWLTLTVWDAQPLLSVWKVGRGVSDPQRRDERGGRTHRQLVGLADVPRLLAGEPVKGDGVSADHGLHRPDDGFAVGVPAGRSNRLNGARTGPDQREPGGSHTHFPQTLRVASGSRMVITPGRCTFTSYLGNTGAEESGLSTRPRADAGSAPVRGRTLRSEPTVFPELEALLDLLPFVRLGADGVASWFGLGDHGVFEVQDASDHGLVQPLGDAVPVGVLTGGGKLGEASETPGNRFKWVLWSYQQLHQLVLGKRRRRRRRGRGQRWNTCAALTATAGIRLNAQQKRE